MAEAVLNNVDSSARVEKLIETLARAGKEMYSACFSQADKRTKASALPLLQRIDDFEVCAALLMMFINNDEDILQELAGKFQTFLDEMQNDLTDLKAKISVNKDFLKQIKGDYESFNHTFDEMTQLISRIDKRVSIENTTNRNENIHNSNMDMIAAEIKLMESEKAKLKAARHLSIMNEERKATEVKLIDAFEEIIMEAESRQLILAEQAKKKAEALCLKAEKKHTDIEMWYLKLKEDHRTLMEDYKSDVLKRYHVKDTSKAKKSKSGNKTPKEPRKNSKSSKEKSCSTSLLSPKSDDRLQVHKSPRIRKSSSSSMEGLGSSDDITPRMRKKNSAPRTSAKSK